VKKFNVVMVVIILLATGAFSAVTDVSAAEVPGKCTDVHAVTFWGNIVLSGNFPANHVEADIKGLHVYRGTNSSNLTLYDSLVAYVNTVKIFMYSDPNFLNGVKYYYQVAAFNDQGDGERSDIMNVTCNGVPPMPQNLIGNASCGSVNLTWDVPLSDGGSPIVNYSIFRGALGAEPIWIKNVTGTSFLDDNATIEDQFYDYEVCAVNSYGAGKRSQRVFIEMVMPEICGKIFGDDSKPLVGVKIEIDGNVSSVLTDSNGSFSIPAMPGSHDLRIWIDGQEKYLKNFTLPEEKHDVGVITLHIPSSSTTQGSNNNSQSSMIYVGIVGVIVIIGIVAFVLLRRRK
jgi:hypothetical protein